jgi:hypothetical protein
MPNDYQKLYEEEKTARIAAEQRAQDAEAKLTEVRKRFEALSGSIDIMTQAGAEIDKIMKG